MSVRRIFQFAAQNLATAALTLPARANRGYRIHDIGCQGTGLGQGVVVTVNDMRSLFIPAINGISNVAYPKFYGAQTAGFFEQLKMRFPAIPSIIGGADEEITFERVNTAGACTVYVWYEELDGADIPNPTEPGGSLNDERITVQYGRQTFSIAAGATETERATTAVMPSGFRGFPFTEVVPSNRRMDLLGIATPVDLTSAPNTVCNGVRVWKEEQSILANDEDFCPVEVFPVTDGTTDQRLALFKTPIPFMPNDEMKIEYNFTNSGGGAEDVYPSTILIFNQVPV